MDARKGRHSWYCLAAYGVFFSGGPLEPDLAMVGPQQAHLQVLVCVAWYSPFDTNSVKIAIGRVAVMLTPKGHWIGPATSVTLRDS